MMRLAASVLLTGCVAQQPIQTPAATQPGTGRFLLQEQVRLLRASRGLAPGDDVVRELVADSLVTWGITGNLSVAAQWPVRTTIADRPGGSDRDDAGGGDLVLRGRWRFLQNDTGAVDTERALAWAGVRLDTGDGPELLPGGDRDSTNPLIGVAYTRVAGRLGVNAAADYEATTNAEPDMLRYGAAVLWRLVPDRFRSDSTSAWYALVELDAFYETNGDHELFASPGVMWEARHWTFEAAVQVPLARELDHRPLVDVGVVLGVRYLF